MSRKNGTKVRDIYGDKGKFDFASLATAGGDTDEPEMGIGIVDSSISGLGGCLYAKGASGNVANEDVVYVLNGLGIKMNMDLRKLMLAGDYICKHLNRSSGSKGAIILSKVLDE